MENLDINEKDEHLDDILNKGMCINSPNPISPESFDLFKKDKTYIK